MGTLTVVFARRRVSERAWAFRGVLREARDLRVGALAGVLFFFGFGCCVERGV